ncbi:hypothetical protein F5Y13DRAFT_192403 [Hypoxylon sp. FL1857]|nr:hypothetical protein F5Y13DRAFT_192403 [Hypoxylon sp. FL1857]
MRSARNEYLYYHLADGIIDPSILDWSLLDSRSPSSLSLSTTSLTPHESSLAPIYPRMVWFGLVWLSDFVTEKGKHLPLYLVVGYNSTLNAAISLNIVKSRDLAGIEIVCEPWIFAMIFVIVPSASARSYH